MKGCGRKRLVLSFGGIETCHYLLSSLQKLGRKRGELIKESGLAGSAKAETHVFLY